MLSRLLFCFLLLSFASFSFINAQCNNVRIVSDILERNSGWIRNDKDDLGNYFSNESCLWAFSVEPYDSISFSFLKMDIDFDNASCPHDFVEIFTGVNVNRDVLTRQCQPFYAMNKTFTTRSKTVFVLFKTDNRGVNRKGFELEWTKKFDPGYRSTVSPRPLFDSVTLPLTRTTTRTTTMTTTPITTSTAHRNVCHNVRWVDVDREKESSGLIESDGYNYGSYAGNQRCAWSLIGPSGFAFRFQFLDVDLEQNSCDGNHLNKPP